MSQYLIKDREFCLYKYLSLLHIHSFQIESLAQMFSCEFYEISKNTFFTEEHLRVTASVFRIL